MPQRRKVEPAHAHEVFQKVLARALEQDRVSEEMTALAADWQAYQRMPSMVLLGMLMQRTQVVVNSLPSDEWKRISDGFRNRRSRALRDQVKIEIARQTRDRLRAWQIQHGLDSLDAALAALLRQQAGASEK